MEEWGAHHKKKFFIDNSIKALILFKEEHQGLSKLHVSLEGEKEEFQCPQIF